MSARVPPRQRPRSQFGRELFLSWLDVLVLLVWGGMLLQLWFQNRLNLLIHPNYHWLVIAAGTTLIILGSWKVLSIVRSTRQGIPQIAGGHLTLLNPALSRLILVAAAILGLVITPRAFSSQTAIDRGLGDIGNLTRTKPQAFQASIRPEDRSITDWIRTLNVYPEPDAYRGQKAKVQGFVIHPPNLPDNYLMISRFVITCCAADVYPVGLPVKLTQSRQTYKPDTWLEVEGTMITESLNNQRQLVIQGKQLTEIPEPKNPYDY